MVSGEVEDQLVVWIGYIFMFAYWLIKPTNHQF